MPLFDDRLVNPWQQFYNENPDAYSGSYPGFEGKYKGSGGGAFGHGSVGGASLDPYTQGAGPGMGWAFGPVPDGLRPQDIYYNTGRFNEEREAIGGAMAAQDQASEDWRKRFGEDYKRQMMGQAQNAMGNMRSEAMAGGTNAAGLRGANMAGAETVSRASQDARNVGNYLQEQVSLEDYLQRQKYMNDLGQFWQGYASNLSANDQYNQAAYAMAVQQQQAQEALDSQNSKSLAAGLVSGIPLVGGAIGAGIQYGGV